MCRRASQLARQQLLSQCWRALVLHTMGSQLLADRRRFRLLLQDPACAPSGGGTEAGGGQGGKGAAGGAGVLPAAPEELAPLPSYVNHLTVEEAKKKYKTHETDTGSAQVQVAVLTARIAYLTKHMQENKKDYASLRGLTAMVNRRKKLLEYLLREDVGEFKRLTSELGIRTNQLLKPKLSGARGRRV